MMKRPMLSQLVHADFVDGAETATRWTAGDFRNQLIRFDEQGGGLIAQVSEDADDAALLNEFTQSLFSIASNAVLQGHSFEVDTGDMTGFTQLVNQYLRTTARVPYPGATPIFVRITGEAPLMFLAGGKEETGVLEHIFAAYPVLVGERGTPGLVPYAILTFEVDDDGRHNLRVNLTTPDEDAQNINTIGAIGIALLCIIADDRQPLERQSAPAKLNKKRAKLGRAQIPDNWKIRYVTQASAPAVKGQRVDKGGTHASPRPHDRRGHARHLASGRIVWVRPSRIGETERHLTRDRDFYRISLKQGANR